jgi:endonuclease/exonuclease/phosphatase family metal-dependent hydrolase
MKMCLSKFMWLTLVSVGLAGHEPLESQVPVQNSSEEVELRVMSFNIEWGGTQVSFEQVVEAIRQSRADVVGIQEAQGNLQRLAGELDWHFDLRNYVISKFPLIEPPGANGRYVFVEVEPGRIVAIANVHLPSDPYGPDAVRDGATPSEVLEIEHQTRMPAIEPVLEPLKRLASGGTPVFLTGDFNAPAHTDWTEATVGARKFMPYPLEWPVSRAVATAGFQDSWRVANPDPVTHPGLTWWAGRPPLEAYAPGDNDSQDRIDFIWFAGPVRVTGSEIAGEIGGPEVSTGIDPWPSDHRAPVTDFLAVPAAMPKLVSTENRVHRTGDEIGIIYNSSEPEIIQVVKISRDGDLAEINELSVSGQGRKSLPSALFDPGHYQLRMRDSGMNATMVRDFWILTGDASPVVEVTGSTFAAGEGIPVAWRDAPGNRNDYLAIHFHDAATDDGNGSPWTYIDALPTGESRFDAGSAASGWPLAPGEYVIRLFEDDGYEVLAESSPFTVESRIALPDQPVTLHDGRQSIRALFTAYERLLDQGWQFDIITNSQPAGTQATLPIIALRSPISGPAVWLLAGIHGEEPAGPNAIAAAIDDIAELGQNRPVIVLPLLNPHGYARNWRYLNAPAWSETVAGQSVGDSSHLLPDPDNPGQPRAAPSSAEAEAITHYILKMAGAYPPRFSIDLHEDNLIGEGYVYSQGSQGRADPFAAAAVQILGENNIAIKMSGRTRFDEVITGGIIGPVRDSSIDELMSSERIIVDGRVRSGPGAETVLVFETPAADLTLDQRVDAHLALIRRLATLIDASADQ